MLKKFGFGSLWIERVMKCVRTVSYSFIHDGFEFGNFEPQRGIRQGDLISPYPYILCVEGLSSMIRRNEETGLLHGCKIARGAPEISHSMKRILQRYEILSGQYVNYGKSVVTFSPNTRVSCKTQVCDILQV